MIFMIGQLVDQLRVYAEPVSYTHLRAHETVLDLVCRLLLEKKKKKYKTCTMKLPRSHNDDMIRSTSKYDNDQVDQQTSEYNE